MTMPEIVDYVRAINEIFDLPETSLYRLQNMLVEGKYEEVALYVSKKFRERTGA